MFLSHKKFIYNILKNINILLRRGANGETSKPYEMNIGLRRCPSSSIRKVVMKLELNEIPSALFCALVLKAAFFSPSVNDVGVMLGFGLFAFGLHYMKRRNVYQDLMVKYDEVVDTVNKQNEVIKKMSEEVVAVKTSVTGVKLAQGFKGSFAQKE